MSQKTNSHNRDLREIPVYGIAEAARYLHMPSATLRSWVIGRSYPKVGGVGSFEALIVPADSQNLRLSFSNLVEAHVLQALRYDHEIRLSAVRTALSYARLDLNIDRPLLSDLSTHAGDVFLRQYGELINLSRSGQLAMKAVLDSYLRRVVRDERSIPLRLFPFITTEDRNSRTIVIDPTVSFGKPTVAGQGVSTAVLTKRIDAGESIEDVADDYDISPDMVTSAIVFEKAA